jgi:hypothetical protein
MIRNSENQKQDYWIIKYKGEKMGNNSFMSFIGVPDHRELCLDIFRDYE